MSKINHPDYKEELERCNYTVGYVKKALESAVGQKSKVDNDLDRIKKHYNSDNMQDYIDLMVNSTLYDSLTLKIRNLNAAKSKPYFARVDFKEKGKNTVEKLYIGKMSLSREEDQELIIVDWRAPIANLYYEERLGDAGYDCPEGRIEGHMSLKRQFTINDGQLQDFFDIDVTTNDELLQSCLGANADNRLKEIVSTIQVEQNRIIRADMWRPLIVQGAAGSGKTTIALHRIAYLIYTYEKSFKPENFMIIAPNRLFLNYISEVLPELGVERVKQTTFEDFALELIGTKLKIADANEKLVQFVNNNATEEEKKRNSTLRKIAELKTSIVFKNMLDDYISIVEQNFIPKEDFKIGSVILYKYEEIDALFKNEYKNRPIVQRIEEIKKHLNSRLKHKKNDIINSIYKKSELRVRHLKETMEDTEERRRLIIEEINKRDELIDKLETTSKKAIKEYIRRISKVSAFDYYRDFIEGEDIYDIAFQNLVDRDLISSLSSHTAGMMKKGYVEIEDLAPIIYLKYKIHGIDEKIPVKHIVIDEAQDFSAFQFLVLKCIIKDSSFTILGDLNQGIHSYRGTRDWQEVKSLAFSDRKVEYLTLEQSYRNTVEIMEAANKVIKKLKIDGIVLAKPVIRHGEEVKVIQKADTKEMTDEIADKIKGFKEEGFKSVAVICKTLDECKKMYTVLKKKINEINIITGKEEEYKNGIVIVPSYLAKGLEFDVVIIANAGREQYTNDELDIKLLYVAMTRALHRLIIYCVGELSPLLQE